MALHPSITLYPPAGLHPPAALQPPASLHLSTALQPPAGLHPSTALQPLAGQQLEEGDLPQYRMNRIIKTVEGLWQEWTIGLSNQLSILELNWR